MKQKHSTTTEHTTEEQYREPDVTLRDGKLYARRFDDTLERFDVSKGYLTVTKV